MGKTRTCNRCGTLFQHTSRGEAIPDVCDNCYRLDAAVPKVGKEECVVHNYVNGSSCVNCGAPADLPAKRDGELRWQIEAIEYPKVEGLQHYPDTPIDVAHMVPREVVDQIMRLIESECAARERAARIDENHQALANFEPEYWIAARALPKATPVGQESYYKLSDRYVYHNKRIAHLKSNQEGETDV